MDWDEQQGAKIVYVKPGEVIEINGAAFTVLSVTDKSVVARPLVHPVLLLRGAPVYISRVENGRYCLRTFRSNVSFSKHPSSEDELDGRKIKKGKGDRLL